MATTDAAYDTKPEYDGWPCRLCKAKPSTQHCDWLQIFGDFGQSLRISEILLQHFGLEVLIDDGHSTRICSPCWSITENFHTLYATVQRSEQWLAEECSSKPTTAIDDVKPNVDETHDAGLATTSNNEQYSQLIIQPDDRPTMTTSRRVQHQESVMTFVEAEVDTKRVTRSRDEDAVKVEVTYSEDDDEDMNETVDVDFMVEDDDGNEDADGADRNDDDDEVQSDGAAADEEQLEPNVTITTSSSSSAFVTSDISAKQRKARIRGQKSADEDQLIRQYYDMTCCLCTIDGRFNNIEEAFLHYRSEHEQAGYIKCCGIKCFRRCNALQHIEEAHVKPQQHRCEKCKKQYTNLVALQSHMRRHRLAQTYYCEQCPKQFATAQSMSRHRWQAHSDGHAKEFGCDICKKYFVTKAVLANHIKGVHENAFAHICHICAKTFKSKQVWELHQRTHADIELPKLQCNICGNWLKHEHSLRKHMARHGQKEEVCKLCNKVAPNRHALGNHMRYVHSERTYQCSLCDKAFKKPIGLKEHMASHTGVDLYFCPYCPKTFKSGANMHSHRKKKHHEQWLLDRDQRKQP